MNAVSPLKILGLLILFLLGGGCRDQPHQEKTTENDPKIPRGYLSRLEIQREDRILSFGPFVGYYFKPTQPDQLERLKFVCFNERSFYTTDVAENTLLYTGTAQFQTLDPDGGPVPEGEGRMMPLFFTDAPQTWLDSRPQPRERFLHFHSAYNATGAVHSGYWLSHRAETAFTYDMGARVDQHSRLFHQVTPGPDLDFARVIEFDRGPGNQ